MNEVLSSSSTSVPSHGQLLLEWVGEGRPEDISQKLILEGSEGPKWLRIRYPPLPSASRLSVSFSSKTVPATSTYDCMYTYIIE